IPDGIAGAPAEEVAGRVQAVCVDALRLSLRPVADQVDVVGEMVLDEPTTHRAIAPAPRVAVAKALRYQPSGVQLRSARPVDAAVERRADRVFLEQLADALEAGVEALLVPDAEREPTGLGQVDEQPGLLDRARQRL